ncbi:MULTISPECIES: cobyrinate a,c-diamide synthase [Sanguibacteroides]|uniref:Cobyrinate a,c-diamide synthase n=1 Tax=Sanguibacteroides justesenii TaxID=1547597 RepID=A0A0C3R4D1_9PORP|nr:MULTISPECIES: cobyrinate a,c-diamide synthase [Sanguibacteroides]KIO44270.1 cobyrinic acid a,c-diamide synthase [Sanguibacteroides justesenii]KIO45514.1 cobyrinic acid a,c-diamide synthase [Sanguibacteroides justesenii]
MRKSQFLIGAASSGSGKTTFTIGLLRALKDRGLDVQPFKCGPDYIDTKYHAIAAGEESVNLDVFMAAEKRVREVYARYGEHSDVCVTEGVMGLFDGYDGMNGSSAEIAALLNIPVILLLNARSTAYSVAPVLYGFKHFYPKLQVAGVVFNFVSSAMHYSYLQQACEDVGMEALGYLPNQEDFEVPSRHLGLTLDETFDFDAFAGRVAKVITRTVDVDRLLELTRRAFEPVAVSERRVTERLRIAVAMDEAFNFVYRENMEVLKRMGEVTFFSPLRDRELPLSDFVYLPGGYPEYYLPELSANGEMLASIRDYGESGGKVFAECGGMMYLCDSISGMDGKVYPMAGLLKHRATMEKMGLKLGYRRIEIDGMVFRGHEFHYSRVVSGDRLIPTVGKTYSAKGRETDTPIYHYKHVLASYIHFYWDEETFQSLYSIV